MKEWLVPFTWPHILAAATGWMLGASIVAITRFLWKRYRIRIIKLKGEK